ncbi:MAG: cytochrome b/b6 domain-containing protein [Hyphomicrobiaceae bacterium]
MSISADRQAVSGGPRPSDTVLIWDLPVRVFHWTLVISIVTAFLTTDGLGKVHRLAGYVAISLIVFRVIWGLIGSRHARFRDFVRGPRKTIAYAADVMTGLAERRLGHNPAGGAMVVALLAVVGGIGITGLMMTTDRFFGADWVETLHWGLAYSLFGLIPLHIIGVVLASASHKENLVRAMLTGRKPCQGTPGESEAISAELETRMRGTNALALMALLAVLMTVGWPQIKAQIEVLEKRQAALQQASAAKPQTGLTGEIDETAATATAAEPAAVDTSSVATHKTTTTPASATAVATSSATNAPEPAAKAKASAAAEAAETERSVPISDQGTSSVAHVETAVSAHAGRPAGSALAMAALEPARQANRLRQSAAGMAGLGYDVAAFVNVQRDAANSPPEPQVATGDDDEGYADDDLESAMGVDDDESEADAVFARPDATTAATAERARKTLRGKSRQARSGGAASGRKATTAEREQHVKRVGRLKRVAVSTERRERRSRAIKDRKKIKRLVAIKSGKSGGKSRSSGKGRSRSGNSGKGSSNSGKGSGSSGKGGGGSGGGHGGHGGSD